MHMRSIYGRRFLWRGQEIEKDSVGVRVCYVLVLVEPVESTGREQVLEPGTRWNIRRKTDKQATYDKKCGTDENLGKKLSCFYY